MPPRIRIVIEDQISGPVRGRKWSRLDNLFAAPMRVLEGPVRKLVLDAIEQQFESEGGYGGTPWQELADRTVEERELLGFPPEHPILRRTDRLFDALQGRMGGAEGGEIEVTKNTFTLRTVNIPDAAAHQYGSDHSNLPARPMIPEPMPEKFMRQLRSIIHGYAVGVEFDLGRR